MPQPLPGSPHWYDANGQLKTHSANGASLARQVFDLTNQERVRAGLAPLQFDLEAQRAAKAHCEDMEARGYFSHVTPEGWDPVDRLQMTGASGYSLWGENLFQGLRDPAAVVNGWMTSPVHRANILHPDFTHLGVGVAEARPFWGQVFHRRP